MKTYVTIPKLIIAVLAIAACGFTFHAWSKAQTSSNSPSAISELEAELQFITELEAKPTEPGGVAKPHSKVVLQFITEPNEKPTEPGELEPALVHARQQASEDSLLLPSEKQLTAPKQSVLLANYPNPFNPETWIPYDLADAADVKVSIYSVDGSLVRMLSLGHQAPGVYQSKSRAAYWDGRNEAGETVASGLYFYTIEAGSFTATRKMLIMK